MSVKTETYAQYRKRLLSFKKTMQGGAKKPKRKNPTKAQKRAKAQKASVQRRVASALAKFLKQANPAMKTAGASIQRLKGGVIKITPIKANAARSAGGWTVDAFHGGGGLFHSKKAAMEHARRLREANQHAGNRGPVRVVKIGGKR